MNLSKSLGKKVAKWDDMIFFCFCIVKRII
jgi:hypothetical protein